MPGKFKKKNEKGENYQNDKINTGRDNGEHIYPCPCDMSCMNKRHMPSLCNRLIDLFGTKLVLGTLSVHNTDHRYICPPRGKVRKNHLFMV